MKENNRFWQFHILFWLVAGTALFASGVTQTTILVAFIRNIYLAITGLVVGPFLTQYLMRFRNRELIVQLIYAIIASYLLAVLAILVINPITFELKGIEIETLTFAHWLSGSLNFALVLSMWCALYLLVVEKVSYQSAKQLSPVNQLVVEKGRQTLMLPIEDIIYIRAAGDYVQIHTSSEHYLKRGTLTSIETAMSKVHHDFLRVHRSIIVNMKHVKGIESHSKGERILVLNDDQRVKSGRSYKEVLDMRFKDQY